MEAVENDQRTIEKAENSYLAPSVRQKPLSKSAQKKLLKQQRFEAKKAEERALMKERKKKDAERKWKEWEENPANASKEERLKLIESRKSLKKERMERRSEDKEKKKERLTCGENITIDLEFSHLVTPTEINSLVQQRWVGCHGFDAAIHSNVHPLEFGFKCTGNEYFRCRALCQRMYKITSLWKLQIMYFYAVNERCISPAHLGLTGCNGEIGNQLIRFPGFDKWIIEKDDKSYIEALHDRKENFVYLTADSDTVLKELDLT